MHVPDGFLGPRTWIPAAAVASLAWAWSASRIRTTLDTSAVPTLGVTTACCFVLMLVTVPLPGGTTIHMTGVGLMAVRFSVPAAYLALSLVLALQALMLGDGGVTALPVSALALGLVGTATAIAAHRALRPFGERPALFAAGFAGTVAAALVTAIALGLQPLLASGADGTPLYFPFGLRTTLPAVVLPHLAAGALEGALTAAAGGRR